MIAKEKRMAVHCNPNYVAKAEETIKDAHDLADVFNDICRIDQAKNSISQAEFIANPTEYNRQLYLAEQLDIELRRKYSTIDKMLNVADMFPRREKTQAAQQNTPSNRIVSKLQQDRLGILCDTALKKAIISSIKEFIDYVD